MLTLLSAVILALTPVAGPQPLISLNGGDYEPADKVRVIASPQEDGYLVVLRVDADGYVRVLFPIDPDLDQFVRGNKRYEIRGRNDKATFLADQYGTGMVFAALGREPFAFDKFAVGTHWDYEALKLRDPRGDVEAQLLTIVRSMADNGKFNYDVAQYRVWAESQPTVVSNSYYNNSFGCLACNWGSYNTHFGYNRTRIGYNRDPWNTSYYSLEYRYGNRWNGWWGWDSWYNTPYRPNVVINVPQRPVVNRPPVVDTRTGTRARPRQPVNRPAMNTPIQRPTTVDRQPARLQPTQRSRPIVNTPPARAPQSINKPTRELPRRITTQQRPQASTPQRTAQPRASTPRPITRSAPSAPSAGRARVQQSAPAKTSTPAKTRGKPDSR